MLNTIFTVFEFIGGIITNSVALLSDSIHDLGDSISIGIAIFLEKKSKKKPDFNYTYGYYRFSLLGALLSSVILLVGSVIIIIEAVNRLINPETINAEMVIWFAVFGIVVNGMAALISVRGKSINEKVISLHMLEDVFGWVALLITAIIMHFTNVVFLDSLLSIAFTIFIGFHVFKNMNRVFHVFLEKAPQGIDIKNLTEKLKSVDNVMGIHHLHLWTLDGTIPLLTLHATVEEKLNPEKVTEAQRKMHEILKTEGINHSTIQIEYGINGCLEPECEELEKEPHIHGHGTHHHHR